MWVGLNWVTFKNQIISGATPIFLTPSGVSEKAAITVRFLKRKKQEFNDLQMEIAQLQEEIKQQNKTNRV